MLVFNHAKRSEWNFVRIIFNFDLFVLEIHINCRTQIIPVHIIEAQHGVRVITEVLRTFQLLVNRLATDAVLFSPTPLLPFPADAEPASLPTAAESGCFCVLRRVHYVVFHFL